MADGINKAILLGHLGQDPELRYTSGGQAVCNLRLATTDRWTGKDGQQNERTEWHTVVVWGKDAENCGKFLKKGRQIYIEGRIETRSWDDREGNKRKTTEIKASRVLLLGGGGGRSRDDDMEGPPPQQDRDAPPDAGDDEIPF
ncbi:MAG: single-stranded DNA-binding protein [Polyangia bacterium]|jgi:single-strand DNA-binding protein|nr:single-stranded DNA-binding protein [Polyangia bacterium]